MKSKLLVLSFLSLAGLAAGATPAQAWLFHHGHGIHRHSTVIICRPYNAFTPVCYGNLVCDGCCPIGLPSHGHGDACVGGACGPMFDGPVLGGYDVGGIPPSAMHPSMYVGAPMPVPGQQPINLPPGAQFIPPGAQAFPPPPAPANTQTYAPPAGYQVAPANYRGQYPMVYYPMNVGQQQQVPPYWYGN
jgi:hypothetical protein